MKVIVVDDHAVFRSRLRRLLQVAGHEVVAEAADGHSALAAVRRLRPDLVLLDVQLPDMDGFEVAELLAVEDAKTGVVLISTREADDYRSQLAASPALGFISKSDLSADALAMMVAP